MNREQIAKEIARCDQEIAAMESQPEGPKAYLTTLGIFDWKRERAILERMLIDGPGSIAAGATKHELRLGVHLEPDARRPGGHVDLVTGIPPIAEWGSGARVGWVCNERFARPGDRVIPNNRRRPLK